MDLPKSFVPMTHPAKKRRGPKIFPTFCLCPLPFFQFFCSSPVPTAQLLSGILGHHQNTLRPPAAVCSGDEVGRTGRATGEWATASMNGARRIDAPRRWRSTEIAPLATEGRSSTTMGWMRNAITFGGGELGAMEWGWGMYGKGMVVLLHIWVEHCTFGHNHLAWILYGIYRIYDGKAEE